jgi:hypothetical protein
MSNKSIFYAFDSPVEYKGLLLYPVRMKDYLIFQQVASCLMLEKNSIKDPAEAIKAIQMSYLEYLFHVATTENALITLFVGLLGLVLGKKDDYDFSIKYGTDENGKPFFEIGEKRFNSADFDELREIIAEQNYIDLPDEKIQKSVRDAMEEARRFKQKLNRSKMASLEDQMIALSLFSGIEIEKIYEMTIRKFFLSIRRANHMIYSNIYITASMSGFVTFKSKEATRGWLVDLEEDDKNADVLMSLDSVKKKIDSSEAKEK